MCVMIRSKPSVFRNTKLLVWEGGWGNKNVKCIANDFVNWLKLVSDWDKKSRAVTIKKTLRCFDYTFFKIGKYAFHDHENSKKSWNKFLVNWEFDSVSQVSSFKVSLYWNIVCKICPLWKRMNLSSEIIWTEMFYV